MINSINSINSFDILSKNGLLIYLWFGLILFLNKPNISVYVDVSIFFRNNFFQIIYYLSHKFDTLVLTTSSISLMRTWHLVALSTRRTPNGALTRFTVRSSLLASNNGIRRPICRGGKQMEKEESVVTDSLHIVTFG